MSYTAPVTKNGFSYAGDALFVETSNANRYRRATLPEIRALFQPSGDADFSKDPVGHWYEAQLLHYGLTPSKTKAVSKTRLLDSLNKGGLVVPTHIKQLEAELKKEWSANEKKAKAELKKSVEEASKGKKRKAASEPNRDVLQTPNEKKRKELSGVSRRSGRDINISINVGSSGVTFQSDGRQVPAARRTKSTQPKPKDHQSEFVSPKPERPKQFARRGGSTLRAREPRIVPSMGTPAIKRESKSTTSNMDDRAGASTSRSLDSIPSYYKTEPDDNKLDHYDAVQPPANGHLRLLNGRYEIECPDLDEWDQFRGYEFSLILTLEGSTMWGAYDFGMFSGIFFLPRRPWAASDDALEFMWRGRENSEGMMSYDDKQTGWIKFLGDGEIEGVIDVYGDAKFTGRRVSGSGTRSERDARSMRQEWDGYNARADEMENESRWR